MAATQFSPTDARRAFPCLDEPAFKAQFSISLARWRNMTTRSNMQLMSQTPVYVFLTCFIIIIHMLI